MDTVEGVVQLREARGVGPEWDPVLAELTDRILAVRARGLPGPGRSEHDGPSPWRMAREAAGGRFGLAVDLAVVAQAVANVREAPYPRPRRPDLNMDLTMFRTISPTQGGMNDGR